MYSVDYICSMKLTVTLLSFIACFLSSNASAQNLTGVWRGYFYQKSFGYIDRYTFEVQLDHTKTNALNGVTYSYKNKVFYGKAELKGLYTKKTKNATFKEVKLVEVKIDDESQPCLMTCSVEYSKIGDLETITGTYTSKTLATRSRPVSTDCGEGRIYLEKTPETDFYKEDFVIKYENELKKKKLAAKPKAPVKKPATAAKPTPKPSTSKPAAPKPPAAKLKPGAEENLVKKTAPKAPVPNASDKVAQQKKDEVIVTPPPVRKLNIPRPEVLRKRSNELAKTITTSARQIRIDLYDNGEIDGDTITVYHNNQIVTSRKLLTHKPITFNIDIDDETHYHEFVMVAENLGSIPPNTALMIVTAGNKRHELFITSTEQKNAVVAIEFKPE